MKQDYYKPYFEAVKKILDGTPVKELDDIRQQCNEAFMKARKPGDAGQNPGDYPFGYRHEDVVMTFAADSENKVLLGADPADVYNLGKDFEPVEFRETGRRILKAMVSQYLK